MYSRLSGVVPASLLPKHHHHYLSQELSLVWWSPPSWQPNREGTSTATFDCRSFQGRNQSPLVSGTKSLMGTGDGEGYGDDMEDCSNTCSNCASLGGSPAPTAAVTSAPNSARPKPDCSRIAAEMCSSRSFNSCFKACQVDGGPVWSGNLSKLLVWLVLIK